MRNALVNRELRRLDDVRSQLRRGEVDVLVLGDSSCLTAAAGDADRSMIPERVGRRLDGARVASIAGPGYNGSLYAEMLRVLGALDQRPQAVVVAVAIRTHLMRHVREHPIYSYRRTRSALARVDGTGRVPWLGTGEKPSPADYAEFLGKRTTSRWIGESTIGNARDQLMGRGPYPWPEDLQRLLFDYFHGEIVGADHPGFAGVAQLGAQLREYDVPAVAYWTVPPLAYGERLYPGEFADHVGDHWARVKAALTAPAPSLTVVEPALEEPDFEDAQNGTEHFADSGREKVAALVAEAIAAGPPASRAVAEGDA